MPYIVYLTADESLTQTYRVINIVLSWDDELQFQVDVQRVAGKLRATMKIDFASLNLTILTGKKAKSLMSSYTRHLVVDAGSYLRTRTIAIPWCVWHLRKE